MKFKKTLTPQEIANVFAGQVALIIGDSACLLDNFSHFSTANSGSFTFANSQKFVDLAENSEARCVLTGVHLQDHVRGLGSNKTWLLSKNVDLLARNIKQHFVFATPYRPHLGIHETAAIHPSVVIGENAHIGPHVVIEENVVIGRNATIHAGVYIGHGTQIGDDFEAKPNAVLASEGFGYVHDELGKHYRVPHTGRLIIGNDVHIGACCCIDRGTLDESRIADGTKIDNLVHLAHNTIVGKNGLITAHVVVAGSTTIGDNFVVGGNSSITGHINICDNVQLGGNSAVANDIEQPGQYTGYPLEPLRQSLKNKMSYTHLAEIRKNVSKLMKEVFPK